MENLFVFLRTQLFIELNRFLYLFIFIVPGTVRVQPYQLLKDFTYSGGDLITQKIKRKHQSKQITAFAATGILLICTENNNIDSANSGKLR
jgi:hypothetical protein